MYDCGIHFTSKPKKKHLQKVKSVWRDDSQNHPRQSLLPSLSHPSSFSSSSSSSSSSFTLSCISLSFKRLSIKKPKKNYKFHLQFSFSGIDFKLRRRFDSKLAVLRITNFDSRFDYTLGRFSTFLCAVSPNNWIPPRP